MLFRSVRGALEGGTVEGLLKKVPVKKGDVFFIPPGTVHAICEGILIAEIQQNSDTTYRLYDYGRLQDGKKRELHIDKALDVCTFLPYDFARHIKSEAAVKSGGADITRIADCEYFRVDKIILHDKSQLTLTNESFVSLLCTEGDYIITHNETNYHAGAGDSVFIPAGSGEITLSGDAVVLATKI